MGSRSGVVPGPRRTSRRSLAADGGEADGGADRVDAAFALAAPKKDQEREKASEKRRRLEGENPGGVTAVLDVQRAEELAAASRDSEMIMGNALAQSSPVCMSTPPGGGSSPGSEAGAKGSPGAKMSLSIKVPGTAEKHDGLEPSRTPHRHRSSSLWHAETPKLHNAIYNAAGGGGEPNVAELTRLLEDSSTRAFIDWPDPTEGWTGLLRKSRACDTGRAPVERLYGVTADRLCASACAQESWQLPLCETERCRHLCAACFCNTRPPWTSATKPVCRSPPLWLIVGCARVCRRVQLSRLAIARLAGLACPPPDAQTAATRIMSAQTRSYNASGMTALHWAAATGNLATVKVSKTARFNLWVGVRTELKRSCAHPIMTGSKHAHCNSPTSACPSTSAHALAAT